MGYSYGRNWTGRMALSCDNCGNVGGVRKKRCPWNYCQAAALCVVCRPLDTRAGHVARGCDVSHARFVAEANARRAKLEAGLWLRCSAILTGNGDEVRVTFENKNRVTFDALMDRATYHAIPLLQPATLEDFRRHGPVAVTVLD